MLKGAERKDEEVGRFMLRISTIPASDFLFSKKIISNCLILAS